MVSGERFHWRANKQISGKDSCRPLRIAFYLLLGTFFTLQFTTLLTALNPQKAVTQFKLDIWKAERGFSQGSIFSIVQTKKGYLWLATSKGLLRFDGVRFKSFTKSNTPQFNDNFVRVLYEAPNGRLWIGSREGLCSLENGEFKAYACKIKVALLDIKVITGCRNGGIWIGSKHGGVTRFVKGRFSNYTTLDGLAGNSVYSLWEEKDGTLWIGTSGGLSKRTAKGTISTVRETDGAQVTYTLAFREKKKGVLWLGSFDGLHLLHTKNHTFSDFNIRGGPGIPKIICLYKDSDDCLWMGSDGDGLFRMKDRTINSFSIADGLGCGMVYSFCEDREGNLWIGTIEGGLHRLQDTMITTYTSKEGLANDTVNCIRTSRTGDLWIASNRGLNKLSPNSGRLSMESDINGKLKSKKVRVVNRDKNGDLWIGTNAGLHRYSFNDKKMKVFTQRDGMPFNDIVCLHEDHRGAIWIGALSGLARFDKGKFTLFTKADGLPSETVICIYEDRKRILRVGHEDGGLSMLEADKFTAYSTKDGLVDNFVDCIYEDKEGNLWAGTHGGLSLLKGKTIVNYTIHSGLIANEVYCIMEDGGGNLWLAGREGISRVSKKELKDFAEGKIKKIHPITYDELDGMKARWCNSSGTKTPDGKLWYGTDKGIAMIDPANIKKNTKPPPVLIEELKVDEKDINLKGRRIRPISQIQEKKRSNPVITLPPGPKRLEFFYTALSFRNPLAVNFKIKLDGYDSDWQYRGNKRSTIYTALLPGKYTFKVIACNSDGVWNTNGDTLSFYIEPFFVQTRWFYFLIALLVLLVVFSGFRLRVRQLKAREKKLSTLVDQRTLALNTRSNQLEKAHAHLSKSIKIIADKNSNILAGIEYARKLQQAVLPTDDRIRNICKDYFILFESTDIVSGDFYWFMHCGDKSFAAVVDCTGHGVPGALLSMIGSIQLHEIVSEKKVADPAAILSHLNRGVRTTLKQETNSRRMNDGMDVALCMMDPKARTLTFSGARRPLYYVKKGELIEIKGDRKSIGGHQKEDKRTFTNHKIDIDEQTLIYLTTDGFADQNNKDNTKYSSKRLKQFLRDTASLGLAGQKEKLMKELSIHRGPEEQRDDITIVGFSPMVGRKE
ncbi:MAG: SpoIIE family protein phosphatase [bacterium]|nr:SpoIIE family protein phosphatase [bacterium]